MICGAILHEQDGQLLFTLSSPLQTDQPTTLPLTFNMTSSALHPAMVQSYEVGSGRIAVCYSEEPAVCALP